MNSSSVLTASDLRILAMVWIGREQKTQRLYFLGRYIPMAGIQFG